MIKRLLYSIFFLVSIFFIGVVLFLWVGACLIFWTATAKDLITDSNILDKFDGYFIKLRQYFLPVNK